MAGVTASAKSIVQLASASQNQSNVLQANSKSTASALIVLRVARAAVTGSNVTFALMVTCNQMVSAFKT